MARQREIGSIAPAARPGGPPEGVIHRFTRGREQPRGVVWFGAQSFWGHLQHFIAAAIATENVDSRDWMTPDEPDRLRARIASVLGGDPGAASLVQALGRDLYLDFVADTGDDVSVSRAVGALLFAPYELPDPDRPGETLVVPRGDILLFGGDTAYPVATAEEIESRVIVPWNQVLEALPRDERQRVLLGIPGNHDWYDGLDGFGRMFRRRPDGDDVRPSTAVTPGTRLDHYAQWARELVRGGTVAKPRALALSGYTPVQNASHFALALAPDLELLAVDRQLKATDPRQKQFLSDYHRSRPGSATLVLLPDPVYLFGDPSRTGAEMIESLHLDLAGRETLVLSGDIHHYERLEHGKLLQVIAGGGGAFVHPARIAKGGLPPAKVWPDAAQSRRLLREVPWKLARGRSGFLPHLALLLLFAPAILVTPRLHAGPGLSAAAVMVLTLILGGVFALIGGALRRRSVFPLAYGAALLTALIPVAGAHLLSRALAPLGPSPLAWGLTLGTLALAMFGGTLVFGGYLALLTLLGLENLQAFAVLDHPGFKHFLRLRIRADGSGIDGWCVGAADPLAPGAKPVLVDHFSWRPLRRRG
jgi:hypothetical protein